MRVHAVCGYRSKSDNWTDKWSDVDFRARNLVKGVKGEPFNGFSQWRVVATKQQLRVDSSPQGQEVAFRVALGKLLDLFNRAGINAATIVPVPSSQTVRADDDYAGARLAKGLSAVKKGLVAAPVLRFARPQPKSHSQEGSRRWQDILPQLRGTLRGEHQRVVLIDDVLTSGGHMRACARYLQGQGFDVRDVFVVGRTVWEKPDEMFDLPVEHLPM